MTIDYVYKVVVDGEVYFEEDASTVRGNFGTVDEVTRYRLVDPEDITDSVNGGYFRGQ